MTSLIEELIDTLGAELDAYNKLLPVENKKTGIIMKNDLLALEQITAKEQEVVDEVLALENKRGKVVNNIAVVMNKKVEDIKVETIIDILKSQPQLQRKLSEIHDNLKKVVHQIMDVNNHNKSLIEQSLELIEFNMNFIQSTRMSPGSNNYTNSATSADMTEGAGMFDAKQ